MLGKNSPPTDVRVTWRSEFHGKPPPFSVGPIAGKQTPTQKTAPPAFPSRTASQPSNTTITDSGKKPLTSWKPGDDKIFIEFCRTFEEPFFDPHLFPGVEGRFSEKHVERVRAMMFEMYAKSQPWMWSALMVKPKKFDDEGEYEYEYSYEECV